MTSELKKHGIVGKRLCAPFIADHDNALTVMTDVVVATIPLMVWAVYVYGARCISIVSVSLVTAILSEYLFSKFILKTRSVSNLSCVVTGILVALAMPVSVPLWLPAFASLFAVIVAKALFGGIGKNLFNPAASGICAAYVLFPSSMTVFTKPFVYFSPLDIEVSSEVLSANHVSTAIQEASAGNINLSALTDEFYGLSVGAIGDISVLLIALGLVYLLIKRVVHFNSVFVFILTVFLVSYLCCYVDSEPIDFIKIQFFSGPMMLIMAFMLNDYTTTPTTSTGRIIFAALLGAGIVGIRYFGLPYGEYFVLLVMNALSPVIEKATYSRVFGTVVKGE